MQVGLDLDRQLQNLCDDSSGLACPGVGTRHDDLGTEHLRDQMSGLARLFVPQLRERQLMGRGGENAFAIADALAVADQNQFTHGMSFEVLSEELVTSIRDSCASG